MMNTPNNQKISPFKLFVLIPVLCMLFMSFSLKIENLNIKKEITELIPVFALPENGLHSNSQYSIIEKIVMVSNFTNAQDTISSSQDKVYAIVDEIPVSSTGDMESYFEQIYADLNYPKQAKEMGIEGKVFVQFVVQKDGTLREVKVIKGIMKECNFEAVRVVKEGPLWIPGKQKGKNVNVRMVLPITFRLDDSSKKDTKTIHQQSKRINGIILSENGDPVIGCNITIERTQISTVSDGDGRFSLQTEPWHSSLVFEYVGMESRVVEISGAEDLQIVLKEDKNYTGTPRYKSVMGYTSVSLNDSSTVVVGRPIANPNGETLSSNHKNEISYDTFAFDHEPQPLYIVDGEVISQKEVNLIHPHDIESIQVLKDKNSTSTFGEKAEDGVIKITLKEDLDLKIRPFSGIIYSGQKGEDPNKLESGINGIDENNPPLIYKDGKEISMEEIKKIDPSSLEKIDVLKGDAAFEKYGQKGQHGVILIKTKE